MPQLRIIHIALCLSSAIITALFGALRTLMPEVVTGLPDFIPLVFLGLSAMVILSAAAFRTTIPPVDAAAGEEAWLTAGRGKAVALWALCEGGVMLAALAFFFGANPWLAGGFAAGGLGYMASQSPGTLAGH
ncbi:MAG TPA: hypothetical protein VG940_09465 [Gemmatimonadales bacterium]|nr:hypothetical protein [Gemmatimonadales bacterium]